jgi:hypothetical protein
MISLLLKRIFLITVSCLLIKTAFSQDFSLPEIIAKSKKSIIPIFGIDVSWPNGHRHLGTGIVIGDRLLKKEYILTCEHVTSIKDPTGKTLKRVSNLFANFNLYNDSIITVPLKIVYSDEDNDFALLEYSFSGFPIPKDSLHRINLMIFAFDNFDSTEDLKEGDPLLYTGYPMSFGTGFRNFPVSRKGIVAQNIKNSSTFLMDGFVQGGNSGSPVFRIKKGEYRLAGIAQSYPNEIGEIVYQRLKEEDRFTIVNPGFTNVKKIDIVSEILITKFGFSK